MNPIEYYRLAGQPATGKVTVNSKPAATPNVVVDGVTYTYRTHFFGNTTNEIAESLTAAINSDRARQAIHNQNQPVRGVWAMYFGNVVRVIATIPGTGGNSIAITTTDSTAFTVDANLAGGAAGAALDTELPAAAALADNTANPTAPAVGSFPHVWDGTTWDRAPGTAENGLDVDVTRLPSGTVAGSATLPAGTNNIGDVDIASVPVVGTHNNAWNNVLTGVGGVSTAVDTQNCAHVTVFGNTSAASTITVQFSQDNTNFYDSEVTISANGNFGKNLTAGARYVRLKSSADVTANATIAAKH